MFVFGPVSEAAHGTRSSPPVWAIALWVAALASFVLWSTVAQRKRAKEMAGLATTLGLTHWGDQLPPDLSLAGTPLADISATWNVFEGVQNGIPVIVFDCRIGKGKGSWCRTVIAARASRDVLATAFSDFSYIVDQCGEWVVFYSPKDLSFINLHPLMPIAELEARISTLG
jgi:hypothetical protein